MSARRAVGRAGHQAGGERADAENEPTLLGGDAARRRTHRTIVTGEGTRDTAGVTTRLLFAYVRRRGGDEAVAAVHERSGVALSLATLQDERSWSSYEDKIALFEAAAEVLDDPLVGRHVGEALLQEQVGAALRLVIGSLGSPQQVMRSIARANAKFSTSASMRCIESGRGHAVITYQLHEPHVPHRQDCLYTAGCLSQAPVLFGLPPADIDHPECQVEGAERCRYELSWRTRRPLRLGLRRTDPAAPFETAALREQLVDLQRTVADLVSPTDLDDLLARIATRAGAAVRGQRYLLAIRLPWEPTPRILGDGYPRAHAHELGSRLLAGEAVAPTAQRLVAEVTSASRRHGWLVAELPPQHGFLPAEQAQLEAYARLAAAALESATALEQARRRGAVAEALFDLAHALAHERDELEITRRVAAAVPTVVGSSRARVLLWDDRTQRLRTVATHGFGDRTAAALELSIGHDDTPMLAQLRADPKPGFVRPDGTPWLEETFDRFAGVATAVAPIVAHDDFIGAVFAGWTAEEPPPVETELLLRRLSSLADQTGIALATVRLVARTRHQATHDALTGLANRVLFRERIEHALADLRRDGRELALCFLDLDGFKAVNDRHGHAVGDELLIQVGQRIVATVRASDAVARLAGDEFGVLLRDVTDDGGVERVAAELVARLGAPFVVDGRTVRIGASVGVAFAPRHGEDPDALLRAADVAMYEAKTTGAAYAVADGWRPSPTAPPSTV